MSGIFLRQRAKPQQPVMHEEIFVVAGLGEFKRQPRLAAPADHQCGVGKAGLDGGHDGKGFVFTMGFRPDMQRNQLIVVVLGAGVPIKGAGLTKSHVGKSGIFRRPLQQSGATKQRRQRLIAFEPQKKCLQQIAGRGHLSSPSPVMPCASGSSYSQIHAQRSRLVKSAPYRVIRLGVIMNADHLENTTLL
ncbi:mll7682 [Mesorhizobium japonicum MAFF 303099]|uniref:Mll7682 protein n=1 Tax=Mesorhizobium japonicum (strain LMG 29417 / CECT 9101 / MAFF 303099) TaxID=266835 RepID=Q985G8_RHILO|nr:mll7682 [Mesorhizobium japonicum MAFF 303099]